MASPAQKKRSAAPIFIVLASVVLVSSLLATLANSGDRAEERPAFRDERPLFAQAPVLQTDAARPPLPAEAVVAQAPAATEPEPRQASPKPWSLPVQPVTEAAVPAAGQAVTAPVVLPPLVTEPATTATETETPAKVPPAAAPVVGATETPPAASAVIEPPALAAPSDPSPTLSEAAPPPPPKTVQGGPREAQPAPAPGPSVPAAALVPPPGKTSAMVERAEKRLAIGDIAGARLFLERGLVQRDGAAALLLGATYDPIWLAERGVHSVAADPEKARAYYVRARDLGVAAAPALMRRLEAASR